MSEATTEQKTKVTALVRTYLMANGQYKVVFYDFQTGINAWAIKDDKDSAEKVARTYFEIEYKNMIEQKTIEVEIE